MHQILLYYKYVNIEDPQALLNEQRSFCESLNLKGRIILSKEGINGTVEGLAEDTQKYISVMLADTRFKDMNFKISEGTGNAFPKLSIKLRNELVSGHLGEDDVDPNVTTGKYITAEQLHELFKSGEEFYIIDMRNDYEHKVGYFKNSILPALSNFRDLPKILGDLEHLKDKKIITVCTGGVRCEKASGYLVKKGFKYVYQLHNGIVTYMEKYPNEDFLGKLYVFDGRVVMGFDTESDKHVIVSNCDKCGKPSENYVDCAYKHCKGHRHFICCTNCYSEDGKPYCSQECFEKSRVEINATR
ncbi:hypothetical protein DOJK_00269 [Patescibacteria group bacterium]|nr:rhodanese-related sulfurtransferase [Candidatus Dojkabacteria bacterium]CAG1020342.1 hypothetical protein DOJK_00269 [Patescibacteria group bacterium]